MGSLILDGQDGTSFAEFQSRNGLVHGAARTDKGCNYPLDRNEDRIVLCPDEDFYAVIDGMGGMGDGDKAAQCIAEEMTKAPREIMEALIKAQGRIGEFSPYAAGACFVSARVPERSPDGILEMHQAGDAKYILINRSRSFLQWMFRQQQSYHESTDQELWDGRVSNCITARMCNPTPAQFPISPVGRVLLCSDGVSDNLTADDLIRLGVRKSAKQLLDDVWEITEKRMKNAEDLRFIGKRGWWPRQKRYPDGYTSRPKPDNRSLIVLDIE